MSKVIPVSSSISVNRVGAKGSANDIRLRLLNKLGIHGQHQPQHLRKDCNYVATPNSASLASTRKIVPFQIPLKRDSNSSLKSLNSSTSSSRQESPYQNSSPRPRTNKIAFSNEVSVLPIPMRNEYSSRIKDRLWDNRLEVQNNIARNTVEFAAEGWNWRTVTEDDGMYVCSVSGALIHPVHCRTSRVFQRLQMLKRQQQQQQLQQLELNRKRRSRTRI